MPNIAKQTTEQHLLDGDGTTLLRRLLPRHWKLREYRPDFGLDFALEVFSGGQADDGSHRYETLGEHIFIQLKSAKRFERGVLEVYERANVEKFPEGTFDKRIGTLETLRHSLEMSELVTVNRMGTAIPVLLILADLSQEQCYFVCLNDYIDKILVPRHEDFTSASSRTVHVPVVNALSTVVGVTALRWYAKRAKLYAAFQRFTYQCAELRRLQGTVAPERFRPDWEGTFRRQARYFAERIARYDFWGDTEMWRPIRYYGSGVRRLLETGSTGHYVPLVFPDELTAAERDQFAAEQFVHEYQQLWLGLSDLPILYEDVCREWFLPTALALTCGRSNNAPVLPSGQTGAAPAIP